MAMKLASVLSLTLLLIWVADISPFPLDTPESVQSSEDTSEPSDGPVVPDPPNLQESPIANQASEALQGDGGEQPQGIEEKTTVETTGDADDDDNRVEGASDDNVKVDNTDSSVEDDGDIKDSSEEEVDKEPAEGSNVQAGGTSTQPGSVSGADEQYLSTSGQASAMVTEGGTLLEKGENEDDEDSLDDVDTVTEQSNVVTMSGSTTVLPVVEGRIGRVVEEGGDSEDSAAESLEEKEEEKEVEKKNEEREEKKEEEKENEAKQEEIEDEEEEEEEKKEESSKENSEKEATENEEHSEEGENDDDSSEEALDVQTRSDEGDDPDVTEEDKQSGPAPVTESTSDPADKDTGDDTEDEGKVGAVAEVDLNDLENGGNEEEEEDEEEEEEEEEEEKDQAGDSKVIDLDEAEKQWSKEHSEEEDEEGSGSVHDELTNSESKEPHSGDDHHSDGAHNHHHDTGNDLAGDGKGHGDGHDNAHGEHVKHHGDTPEDKESKKRTAIIVGVAVGGVALFTLAFFTSRQCKQKAEFTPLQKTKGQSEPETIEFRPVGQTGTPLLEDEAKNGLYRHGPRMGPPSPRFHRKAEGKFKFPDNCSDGGKLSSTASPAIVPLLGESPSENGKQDNPKLKQSISSEGGAKGGDTPSQVSSAGTPSASAGAAPQADGLYRHGPRMGPPSPRMHRKAEGKFAFPAAGQSSEASSPAPSGSSAGRSGAQPAGGEFTGGSVKA